MKSKSDRQKMIRGGNHILLNQHKVNQRRIKNEHFSIIANPSNTRTISPSNLGPSAGMDFGLGTLQNNNNSPYSDYIHFNTWGDGTAGNQNLIMYPKNAMGMRIYQAPFGSTTSYSTYKDAVMIDQNSCNVTLNGVLNINNLLLQGDGTNAYIRSVNGNSNLYLGANGNANNVNIDTSGNLNVTSGNLNVQSGIMNLVNGNNTWKLQVDQGTGNLCFYQNNNGIFCIGGDKQIKGF